MSDSGEKIQHLNVRLTEEELTSIVEAFSSEVSLSPCKLWLFGSRTDLARKGGDIDLFIELPEAVGISTFDLKQRLRVKLKAKLCERKIDLVVQTKDTPPSSLFEMIRQEGVLLWTRSSR